MTETILTSSAPAPIGPYSQGKITKGEFAFLSGQIPLLADGSMVEGGITEQTRQVILNVQAVLQAGGFELANVVKTTVFLKDMNDFVAMNGVYSEFFGETKPARSTVEVARLPKDVSVEIEVVAVR